MDDPVAHARHRLEIMYERISQSPTLPKETMPELFEEFSVILEELHQANEEQRVQFDELLHTRQLLEEERKRYQELFEYAPDAYIVTDTNGNITTANRAAAHLLGMRQDFLVRKPLSVFIASEDQHTLTRLIHSPQPEVEEEIRLRPRDSTHLLTTWVRVSANEVHRPETARLRWLFRDITAQKDTLARLEASELRFRTMFEEAQVGMCLMDPRGRLEECNRAFIELTGYPAQELNGKIFYELAAPPADTAALETAVAEILQGRRSNYWTEQSFRTKAGKTIWARLAASLLRDSQHQPAHLLFILENITAEKEAALELAELNRRLRESSEIERLRLAQELHDGPIQDLYGAIFALNSVQTEGQPAELTASLKEVQEMLKGVASTLRSICGELRPPTLSNLGVERAIRSHAERLNHQNPDLEIELRLDADEQSLSSAIRLALFRAYQQAILNVIRHARATKAMVELRLQGEAVVLRVCDNGVGFQAPLKMVELVREGHYGLAGISERIQSLGGTVRIHSDHAKGTCIEATIPRT